MTEGGIPLNLGADREFCFSLSLRLQNMRFSTFFKKKYGLEETKSRLSEFKCCFMRGLLGLGGGLNSNEWQSSFKLEMYLQQNNCSIIIIDSATWIKKLRIVNVCPYFTFTKRFSAFCPSMRLCWYHESQDYHWAARRGKECWSVPIESKAPSVELYCIKAELCGDQETFQQQQQQCLFYLHQDAEHQWVAFAAPALQALRPASAAFLGLFAFSPPASRIISLLPGPTCFFQLFLLQFTFRCAGPPGRKGAFPVSVQDPTRQAAHSRDDGEELPQGAVQPHLLCYSICNNQHVHIACTNSATWGSYSVWGFHRWTGCASRLWHAVLHLALHTPQASAALPMDPRHPPRIRGALLLVDRAAQHPRADDRGSVEQPGPYCFKVSPADHVVRHHLQHLDVRGGPHRLRPAVDPQPPGAFWFAGWSSGSWHAPPEAEQQLRSFLQSLGHHLRHQRSSEEKNFEIMVTTENNSLFFIVSLLNQFPLFFYLHCL